MLKPSLDVAYSVRFASMALHNASEVNGQYFDVEYEAGAI